MIAVARLPAPQACSALERKGANGLTETEHALWYFANIAPALDPLPAMPTKPPGFKAYKQAQVRSALEAMFGGRCAYCEATYAHTTAMEIEHYRPKGGVLDDLGVIRKPGYFWLAASWPNLLASCNDCNRERRLHLRTKGGDVVKSKSGKANKFPLASGSPRATGPHDLAAEVPLLLNPCDDDPTLHLSFRRDGFAEPATTPAEQACPKGRTTIEVCGLDRDALVAERRAVSKLVLAQMRYILQADSRLAQAPHDPIAQTEQMEAEHDLTLYDEFAFRALIRSMKAVFSAVRQATAVYRDAESNWRRSPSATNAQTLQNCVSVIKGLLASPLSEPAFVEDLLRFARIPIP